VTKELAGPIAFVLGGGVRGGHAYQAKMVRALLEREIRPDLIVGTSGGAIQGAMLAADPTPGVAAQMAEFWHEAANRGVARPDPRGALRSLRQRRFALSSAEPLRRLLAEFLGTDSRFEDLPIPLHTCAASIERAAARYFEYGPLIPAVLASCATPGLFPPYQIGEEHFVDGGVVESAPISRALSLGAQTVFVLRPEQREPALRPPRWPWEISQVSSEIARRHHLATMLDAHAEGIAVHLVDADCLRGLDEHVPTLPVELTPFVATKLDRFFDLCDQNRDDAVAETDLLALGARIAEAFGARTGSLVHQRLEQAFADFWTRIRAAAGQAETAAKSLRREEFRPALARLTTDRAAYDEHVYPLIETLLTAADDNADHKLSPAELASLLHALGVAEGDVHMFLLRLDTAHDDDAIALDDLNEAFCAFFTSQESGAVGNAILGS
jgi:predicted acylesterase/phospholipase RssA